MRFFGVFRSLATLVVVFLVLLGNPSVSAPADQFEAYGKALTDEKIQVKVNVGQPGKPVIVMIHGWATDQKTWTDPIAMTVHETDDAGTPIDLIAVRQICTSMRAPDSAKPLVDTADFSIHLAESYDYRLSSPLWKTLANKGCNLVTWSQFYPNREVQYAVEELGHVINKVLPSKFPGNDRVIFIVHSRGSLVARLFMAQNPAFAKEKVKALLMLAPGNNGSFVATIVSQLNRILGMFRSKGPDLLKSGFPELGLNPGEVVSVLEIVRGFLTKAIRFIDSVAISELDPRSKVIRSLASQLEDEKRLGIPYFLFQGISPFYNELYLHRKGLPNSTDGRGFVQFGRKLQSLFLDKAFNEVTTGKGDGLISLSNARLGFEVFEKRYFHNHMTILIAPGVQKDILTCLEWVESGKIPRKPAR